MNRRFVRGAQPSVWVLRGVVVAGMLLGLLAGVPARDVPPVLVIVLVTLGAVLSSFRPEHLTLSITIGLVVVWWAFAADGEMPAGVLVAAAGVTAAHVAGTLLAYGPPALPVDPRLAMLWTGRGVLVWLVSLVVWGVARTYTGHATPATFWLAGLAAALVGSVVAGASLPVRRGDPRG